MPRLSRRQVVQGVGRLGFTLLLATAVSLSKAQPAGTLSLIVQDCPAPMPEVQQAILTAANVFMTAYSGDDFSHVVIHRVEGDWATLTVFLRSGLSGGL